MNECQLVYEKETMVILLITSVCNASPSSVSVYIQSNEVSNT